MIKGGQAVVGVEWIVFGGDADGGSGGGTDGGGGGDRRDGYGYRDGLYQWEDNVAYLTLGTEPNATLAYDMGLEIYQLIISTIGEPVDRLEREGQVNVG